MNTYKIVKYTSEHFQIWNNFVANAKNATFLFHRDFVEYHADRFEDFSLLVFDEKDNLKGILPANISNNKLYSHQGLTYGGIVIDSTLKIEKFISIYSAILHFLNENNIEQIDFKLLPSFYCSQPSEELKYALFLSEAKLTRRDALVTIDLQSHFKIDSNRVEGVKRAEKLGLEIKKEIGFADFWKDVLIPNLNAKHEAKPVHSLAEIQSLQSKFPKNIAQYNVYQNDQIIAGTTLFIDKKTVHVQYISAIGDKNQHGALDYLFHHLITEEFANYSYFDFGISNENQGKNINKGLQYWKETFGARTFCQDFYEVETKNFVKLNQVFL
ncbi:GNAT family protein [Flavobacterium facile]|uniref:GNAT family N-acetyltransferase n=1 Tax=Flavobacterium facile TaxID=2893174 RepID=UPI002E7608A3|nr:GNAT family N-acetyltransferase [Flavobacterium sp. T-12]